MTNNAKQAKRIREGDQVVVISGNERGKVGKVISRVGHDRLLIQGINVRKKAVRRTQENPQGGFLDLERPIHASNVMLATSEGKGFRAKVRCDGASKEIYGVVGGNEVVHRTVSKTK